MFFFNMQTLTILKFSSLLATWVCLEKTPPPPTSWTFPLIPVQTDATLLDATCCILLHTLLHVVGCCCAKFETGQTFQPTTLVPLLFRDCRSVAQQCWIHLHSSSNIVGATHTHYVWFTKTYGLYPSHDALHVPTLLGVVASVCTPLPTCTQQLPTLLAQ